MQPAHLDVVVLRLLPENCSMHEGTGLRAILSSDARDGGLISRLREITPPPITLGATTDPPPEQSRITAYAIFGMQRMSCIYYVYRLQSHPMGAAASTAFPPSLYSNSRPRHYLASTAPAYLSRYPNILLQSSRKLPPIQSLHCAHITAAVHSKSL